MFIYTFVLTVMCMFDQDDGLVTLPKVEDNPIIKAESVIRTTVNTLFSALGMKKVKDKPRLKQYSVVHNYLISLTLQDYNSLKEIAKLTRVDKSTIVNDTIDYIVLLNEILGEDNVIKLQNIIMGEDIKTEYDIEGEIEKLEYLQKYQAEQNVKIMDINKEVLKILLQEESLDLNVTVNKAVTKDDENLLDDLPTWHDDDELLISGRRIYDGKQTRIKKFPFMASVQIFNKFQCAGSIIKSDLIITAASCLQLAYNNRFYRENPAFLSVRVGSSFYEIGGENIAVLEVYFHPSYNPKNLHNNLALMRLVRKIRLKKRRVKKIRLDEDENGLPLNLGLVEVLGWGAHTRSNILHGPFEDKLRHAALSVYPLEDCRDVYSKEFVTRQNFCAGSVSVGSGACNRDVGGPGIFYGKLAGVISFGAPICGNLDAPTVFTKVGYYFDWIEQIMEQDVPSIKQRTTPMPPTFPYEPPEHDTKVNPWFLTPFTTQSGHFIGSTTTLQTPKRVLRYKDKRIFKEFLKTMFESAEIQEYLDSMTDKALKSGVEASEQPNLVQRPITEQSIAQLSSQQMIMQQEMMRDLDSYRAILQQLEKQQKNLHQPNNTNHAALKPKVTSIMEKYTMEPLSDNDTSTSESSEELTEVTVDIPYVTTNPELEMKGTTVDLEMNEDTHSEQEVEEPEVNEQEEVEQREGPDKEQEINIMRLDSNVLLNQSRYQKINRKESNIKNEKYVPKDNIKSNSKLNKAASRKPKTKLTTALAPNVFKKPGSIQKNKNDINKTIDEALLALLYVSDSEQDKDKWLEYINKKNIKSKPIQDYYRSQENISNGSVRSYSYPQTWENEDDLGLRKIMTNDFLEFLNQEIKNHIINRHSKLAELEKPIEVSSPVHYSTTDMNWKQTESK